MRTYIVPTFGVGYSKGPDIAKVLEYLKELPNALRQLGPAGALALKAVLEIVEKHPGTILDPYAVVKEIGKAIASNTGVSDFTDWTTCEAYLPLSHSKLDGKGLANASITVPAYQVQKIFVSGQVWYTEKSGKKMFGNRDLLSADSRGWLAQWPSLGAGFVGGPLLMV